MKTLAAMVSGLRGNHVTDDTLSRLLSGELSTASASRAHKHLGKFGSGEHLTEVAGLALGELLLRHRTKLLATLQQQAEIFAELGTSPSQTNNNPPEAPADPLVRLLVDGDNNLALCKELISGSSTASRSTELVISGLKQSVADLRTAALLMPEGSEALQAHQETH